ncbi:MAG TPA: FliH/SctL family protein [Bryobacteraceae bacterium]|jgi:flagellar assembly protein FliH
MLSKVISRGNAASVQALVFPDLTGYERGRQDRGLARDTPNTAGHEENTAHENRVLREKLHQLESQSEAERRAAFEAGRREGESRANAELQPVLERLNASVTQVLAMRSDLRRSAERDVVKLSLLIAQRVLHRQLTVDEGALTAIARVAFERLMHSETYRVVVHPRFAAAVASAVPGSHSARIRLDPDPECAQGTLTIHSTEGTVDASVDAQLEEISRGLADRIL